MQAPGVPILGQVRDARFERSKAVIVSPGILASLLQMDGSFALKMEGWPEGAVVIGSGSDQATGNLVLILHKPDWPRRLTGAPPEAINIHWKALTRDEMPEPPAESVDEID